MLAPTLPKPHGCLHLLPAHQSGSPRCPMCSPENAQRPPHHEQGEVPYLTACSAVWLFLSPNLSLPLLSSTGFIHSRLSCISSLVPFCVGARYHLMKPRLALNFLCNQDGPSTPNPPACLKRASTRGTHFHAELPALFVLFVLKHSLTALLGLALNPLCSPGGP